MSGFYETEEAAAIYAEFHYGSSYFGVTNFAEVIVDTICEVAPFDQTRRALDVGCALGRSCFELARRFDHVDGVDSSELFIKGAVQLLRERTLDYSLVLEGDLRRSVRFELDSMGLEGRESNVAFHVGDACNLAEDFRGYDVIVAANLVDRLHDPKRFLLEAPSRLRDGGVLALSSPYTWMPAFTPRENWLGGIERDGRAINSYDGVVSVLSERFCLVSPAQDIPFVIRETERKFQHSISQLTIWRLKGRT